MNNQDILNNAPEGATHVSEDYGRLYLRADPEAYVSSYSNSRWNDNDVKTELLHFHTIRSLADIERIVELEDKIAEQDEKIKMFGKECEAYKEVLRYCKHNKTGQGAKINGVFWLYSDD